MSMRNRQNGQSLVEFALLVPLMFLFVVNVVNFGGCFLAYRAKFVRSGPDGAGVQLIHLNEQDRPEFQNCLAGAWPRRAA
jgi:hypothetical protein